MNQLPTKQPWNAPVIAVYGRVEDITGGGVKQFGATDGFIFINGLGLQNVS